MVAWQVYVNVIEARSLSGLDSTNASDPFVQVEVGPVSRMVRRTVTRPESLNPVWQEKFLFSNLELSRAQLVREKVRFKVYDRNSFRPNGLIGSYEFSLGHVYRRRGHQFHRQWVPLSLPNKPETIQGYLLLSVFVLADGDDTPIPDALAAARSGGLAPGDEAEEKDDGKHDDDQHHHHHKQDKGRPADSLILRDPHIGARLPHVLNVMIYTGEDVLLTQSTYMSRCAFMSVRFNGNALQTSHVPDVANPVWNRKFEMPFHLPLTSDSIEVQMWNRTSARPDVLIGEAIFNYHELRLMQSVWGPRWINLYSAQYVSPETSLVGYMRDALSRAQPIAASNATVLAETSAVTLGQTVTDKIETEYVGRVLVRMSVSVRDADKSEPLLLSVPIHPALQPPTVEYAVHCVLYATSEVPVLGGRIRAEVAFGNQRVHSAWRMGKQGAFTWNESLAPIKATYPTDTSQVPHLFLNLYHGVGASSRKIAFACVPASSLLPMHATGSRHTTTGDIDGNGQETSLPLGAPSTRYSVNGVELESAGSRRMQSQAASLPWNPRWRTLHHVSPDPKKPHVVAGFVLCSIGFGHCTAAPRRVPRPIPAKMRRYKLRAYVHQAANLPGVDGNGSSNPFLVIRFAGRIRRLHAIADTLFPFWRCEADIESPIALDPQLCPSVYLSVYHRPRAGWSVVFMGRAEVPASHIFDHQREFYRYPISFDRRQRDEAVMRARHLATGEALSGASTSTNGATVTASTGLLPESESDPFESHPYVLAAFELIPFSASKRKPWLRRCPEGTMDLALKVECLGLREIAKAVDHLSQPVVEFSIPLDEAVSAQRGRHRHDGNQDDDDVYHANDRRLPDIDVIHVPSRARTLRRQLKGSVMAGEASNVLKSAMFDVVRLPVINPAGVPLRIRVFEDTHSVEEHSDVQVVGSVYVPLTHFIASQYRKVHGAQHEGGDKEEPPLLFDAPPIFINDPASMEADHRGQVPAAPDTVYGGTSTDGGTMGRQNDHAYDDDSEDGETDMDELLAGNEPAPRRSALRHARSAAPKPQRNVTFHVDGQANGRRRAPSVDSVDTMASRSHVINMELDALNVVTVDGTGDFEHLRAAAQERGKHSVLSRHMEAEAAQRNREDNDNDYATAAPAPVSTRQSNRVRAADVPDLARIHPNFYALPLLGRKGLAKGRAAHTMIVKGFFRVAPVLRRRERNEGRRQRSTDLVVSLRESDLLGPFRALYSQRFVTRVYVYDGFNLTPPATLFNVSSPRLYPYVLATNGMGSTNDSRARAKKTNDYEPAFYEVFELAAELPRNARMRVSVMTAADVARLDREVGRTVVDAEELMLIATASHARLPAWGLQGSRPVPALEMALASSRGNVHLRGKKNASSANGEVEHGTMDAMCGRRLLPHAAGVMGCAEFFPLYLASSQDASSRGGVTLRLDVMTELQARRQRAEELIPPIPSEYEIRLVLWNTRQVAFPDNKRVDDDVNQRVAVSYDAEGSSEDAVLKTTDVAWGAAHGSAEWNHRFLFPARLPCTMPRIKLALFHSSVVYGGDLLGEVLLDMQPFFERAMRDRKAVTHEAEQWVAFSHPNFPGTRVGEALVEMWLYTRLQAEKKPAGEAQHEPNADPFLPAPFRNPPPWAVGSRALDWLEGRKRLLLCLLCLVIFIPILLPLILAVYKSALFK